MNRHVHTHIFGNIPANIGRLLSILQLIVSLDRGSHLQILRILWIFIPVLAIVACGGDDNDEIVGTWKLISASETLLLTFYSDGRYMATGEGRTSLGTYTVSGNLVEVKFEAYWDGNFKVPSETETSTFSISDDLMTVIIVDGSDIIEEIFEKV